MPRHVPRNAAVKISGSIVNIKLPDLSVLLCMVRKSIKDKVDRDASDNCV
jgi:hypothetical protein